MIKKIIFRSFHMSIKGETQFLKLNTIILHKINLNLIGKIQLKNVLMAIIAAKNSYLNLEKF